MPTYVYKFVETGETIEVQQGFHDENLTSIAHPDSGEMMPVKKVFTPVGVTFKGSGFFKTDNRGKKPSSSSSDASTKSESKSESSKSTESKSESSKSESSKSTSESSTKKSDSPSTASTKST